MLGRLRPSQCAVEHCHAEPAGPDCSDRGKDRRSAKRVDSRWAQRDVDSELVEYYALGIPVEGAPVTPRHGVVDGKST